ncbi:MAG TPA: dephospho-CoA kinase [Acidimicrobiales bacterium]|nr:dephospho-CoA kinase [Acidimicrobiales bacterium]
MVIGLTGGMGTGKSSVASLLVERGAVLVDADALAHEVMAPGGPAYGPVIERFGQGIVDGRGVIDRRALADVVFADPVARRDLEALVHPPVLGAIDRRLAAEAATDHVVVVVVPLLVEAGWDRADTVVVVDASEEVAVRRLVENRGMAEDDVRRRLAAQADRATRLAHADHVITNDGSLDDLRRQVDALWEALLGSGDAQGGSSDPERNQNAGPAASAPRPPLDRRGDGPR